MNNTLKRIFLAIGVLMFVVLEIRLYMDLHKLEGRTSLERSTTDSRLDQLNNKISTTQSNLANIRSTYDEKIKELRQEQDRMKDQIKDQIKDIVKKMNDLRVSTTTQNNDLSKSVHTLQDKDKEWIKESVTAMRSFEDDLAANQKDMDSLRKVELPGLNKEINDFRVDRVYSRQSNVSSQEIFSVEKRIDMLEKQFKEIQENTLSIILKTPH